MPTLSEIFDKRKITLYHNESLDLDHYYQEPYQDEDDEIKEMGVPFETDQSKKKRSIDLANEDRTYSGFSFFMDGSRRTYKIGDVVLEGKKIFPVVVAQVRAGCTERDDQKKLHSFGGIRRKNLLLLSDKTNDVDFAEIRQRILKTRTAQELNLDVVKYRFEPAKDNVPVNAAIAKANSIMHDLEIEILGDMVTSGKLKPDHMLVVDGPLQFIRQDTGKPEFADLFYNVAGVSKSFDPMLPTSSKARRGGTQIGTELLKLDYSNPMHIYREYIQNASDSIDKAIATGVLLAADAVIHIEINRSSHTIIIRDNGVGIEAETAQTKLMSVGASDKDGINERGFRGIGRLGGLAYASRVQFITSALGESTKTIMTCDCDRLQQLLQKSNNETADIMETFRAISQFDPAPEVPESHYFEVRLMGVPEESGLLDEPAAIQYLAETAPIDFDSQKFVQAGKIRDFFSGKGFPIPCYSILRGSRKQPIYKLYSRSISTGKQERTKNKDYIRDVEFIYKDASDGKPLFIGWIAITDFSGSISTEAIQGIRFRKGNILVGDHETFSKFFPLTAQEASRANKFFAGEIYALHDGLVPNSQRDDFEPGAVYNELKSALSIWAGEINKKYRRGTSEATSALRNLNKLNDDQKKLEEDIDSGAITSDEKREQIAEQLEKIRKAREKEEKTVRKALERGTFDDDRKQAVEKTLTQTEAAVKKETAISNKITNAGYATKNDLPSSYSRDERKLYQRIISVIDAYFSNDPQTAESLREQIKSELSVKRK